MVQSMPVCRVCETSEAPTKKSDHAQKSESKPCRLHKHEPYGYTDLTSRLMPLLGAVRPVVDRKVSEPTFTRLPATGPGLPKKERRQPDSKLKSHDLEPRPRAVCCHFKMPKLHRASERFNWIWETPTRSGYSSRAVRAAAGGARTELCSFAFTRFCQFQ